MHGNRNLEGKKTHHHSEPPVSLTTAQQPYRRVTVTWEHVRDSDTIASAKVQCKQLKLIQRA